MSNEHIMVPCSRCGLEVELPPQAGRFQCSQCGRKTAIVRCKKCRIPQPAKMGLLAVSSCWNCKKTLDTGLMASGCTAGDYADYQYRSGRDAGETVSVLPAVYMGGHGYKIPEETPCAVLFQKGALEIRKPEQPAITIPHREISAFELSGPGAVQTGGGFIGGGFGLAGAAAGILTAGLINRLTTSTRILTVVRIATESGELFFQTNAATPDELRLGLSESIAAIDAARTARHPGPPTGSRGAETVAELSELSRLREAGALTDEEFVAAKKRTLGT